MRLQLELQLLWLLLLLRLKYYSLCLCLCAVLRFTSINSLAYYKRQSKVSFSFFGDWFKFIAWGFSCEFDVRFFASLLPLTACLSLSLSPFISYATYQTQCVHIQTYTGWYAIYAERELYNFYIYCHIIFALLAPFADSIWHKSDIAITIGWKTTGCHRFGEKKSTLQKKCKRKKKKKTATATHSEKKNERNITLCIINGKDTSR